MCNWLGFWLVALSNRGSDVTGQDWNDLGVQISLENEFSCYSYWVVSSMKFNGNLYAISNIH